MKKIKITLLLLVVLSTVVFAAGRIQNEDVKSLAEITAGGGSSSSLINDSKLYMSANGANKQLSEALSDGTILTSSLQFNYDTKFFVSNTAVPTKRFNMDLSGATASTMTTFVFSQTADRSITLPNATDTLVGKATTDTLTNKTIDAASNTISNIANANISGTAAIARSKMASGTADHVLINDGTGVMSSEAQLAISRGGTNASTATNAFNNLSPLTTKGDLVTHNGANNIRIGVGSDGQVLTADSTQASGVKWAASGGGGGSSSAYEVFTLNGGITYIDQFDGVRRSMDTRTMTSVVACAGYSGSTGTTIAKVDYGSTLQSTFDVTVSANGSRACTAYPVGVSLGSGDFYQVSVTKVAEGAPYDLTVEFKF